MSYHETWENTSFNRMYGGYIMPEEKMFHEVDNISCDHHYTDTFKCRISYQKYTLEKKEKTAERIKVDIISLVTYLTGIWT